MNRFAVLLASATANTAALPAAWPVETRELAEGETAAAPWVEMTEAELTAHVATHEPEKEAWNAAQDAARPKRWGAREFLDRFTDAELVAIATAARTDAVLDVIFRKLSAATEVHSDSAELAAGLDYLVELALLTPERRAALLTA